MAGQDLLKTPLNSIHRAMGAKMVDFGGWDMPVEYKGVLDAIQPDVSGQEHFI